jgi:hypothetical protein
MEYKTKNQIEQMTSNEIANYLSEITQTDLCKDEKYCKMILEVFINKKN